MLRKPARFLSLTTTRRLCPRGVHPKNAKCDKGGGVGIDPGTIRAFSYVGAGRLLRDALIFAEK